MSRCISRHGEFSEHDLDRDFACVRCHDLDEDALIADRDRLAATVERVRTLCDEGAWSLYRPGHGVGQGQEWRVVNVEHLRAALDPEEARDG